MDTILGSLTDEDRRTNPLYQYSADHKYMMGVDPGGYDATTFSICVMRDDGHVMAINKTHDAIVHTNNVLRLTKYYHIDHNSIVAETLTTTAKRSSSICTESH